MLSEHELKEFLIDYSPSKINQYDFQINCPECGKRECGISIKEKNHPWGCYRKKECGVTGNIFTLKKYGLVLDNAPKIPQSFVKRTLSPLKECEKDLNLPLIKMPIGFRKVSCDEYLSVERNFSNKDFEYWGVGNTKIGSFRNYMLFPITLNEELVAFVGRSKKKYLLPKYKNSVSKFSYLLGGYDKFDACHTVILTEGIFDAINVTRLMNLYDCDTLRSVCTFGAKVSSNQIKLLQRKNVKQVILLFDNDVIEKIKKIAFELEMFFDVKIALIKEAFKDAGDCNLEDLIEAIGSSQSPLYFSLNKIDKKVL